jgi:TolB-like protein
MNAQNNIAEKIPQKSIAVLPFVSFSQETENDYFADGITEEIINALTKVQGLKVIARTSSFAFKGKNIDVRIIGKELGVRAVLEGSVRRTKDRIRVTAPVKAFIFNNYDYFHQLELFLLFTFYEGKLCVSC